MLRQHRHGGAGPIAVSFIPRPSPAVAATPETPDEPRSAFSFSAHPAESLDGTPSPRIGSAPPPSSPSIAYRRRDTPDRLSWSALIEAALASPSPGVPEIRGGHHVPAVHDTWH